MKDNVYIGARYVVSPEGEYDPLKEYGSLSMVSYENSGVYVSRQPVPVNTPPTKGTGDSYWALMFPVDPQIEGFKEQLNQMAAQLNNAIADMREEIESNDQNILDQIAAKFAQQDAVITKATTDVANFIDTANQTITEYTNKIDNFISEYEPPAEAYGLLPQLVITANPTATINAVQGTTVRNGTVPANGVLYLNVNAYGTWRVTASFQAQETSQTVIVDDVKQYTLNLTQAERQYKIILTNTSTLPIVTQGRYRVTDNKGFNQTHNMAIGEAWECSVPTTGTYNVFAIIPNLLPSKNRTTGETEYIPTSISGTITYATVDSTIATISNEQETTTASLSIPKLTVALPNASGYQEIQIQPPVVTEKSTDIYHDSDFSFIPWARGNWFMRNSTADFETTENISSVDGYSGSVELMPEPSQATDWKTVNTFNYHTSTHSSNDPAPLISSARDTIATNLLLAAGVFNGGYDPSTKMLKKLKTGSFSEYEDGSPVNDNDDLVLYIPAFQYQLENDVTKTVTVKSGTPMSAFKDMRGTFHKGIGITLGEGSNPYTPSGPQPRYPNNSNAPRYDPNTDLPLYELMRADHVIALFILHAIAQNTTNGYYSTNYDVPNEETINKYVAQDGGGMLPSLCSAATGRVGSSSQHAIIFLPDASYVSEYPVTSLYSLSYPVNDKGLFYPTVRNIPDRAYGVGYYEYSGRTDSPYNKANASIFTHSVENWKSGLYFGYSQPGVMRGVHYID